MPHPFAGMVTSPRCEGPTLVSHHQLAHLRRAAKLKRVFPRVYAHIAGPRRDQAWTDLAIDYFADGLGHEPGLLGRAAGFAAFLARNRRARELPEWLPALADLEWWLSAVRAAPDDPTNPHTGSLRLSQPAELRPYAYDVVHWLKRPAASRPEEPEAEAIVALVWRDATQAACVRAVTGRESRLLSAIRQELRPIGGWARWLGLTPDELDAQLATFRAAGVVVGDPHAGLTDLGDA